MNRKRWDMGHRPGGQLSQVARGIVTAFILLQASESLHAQDTPGAGAAVALHSTVLLELSRALLWIVGAFFFAKVVQLAWNRVLIPLANRTRTQLDVLLLQRTRMSAQWLSGAVVLNIGAHSSFKRFPGLAGSITWEICHGALYTLLVFSIAALVYAAAKAVIDWYGDSIERKTQHRVNEQFVLIFRKGAKFVFFFVALTIVLDNFGVQITGLLATAGVASLAVAFAAQETLSNMISGFVLMADHPFKPGDRVELVNGMTGDVIDVGLRTTKILSFDNTVINIPNSEIAKAQVINISAPDLRFKIRATIGVAYGSDLRKVKRILLEVFTAHAEVLKDPAPGVYFTEFGESSLNLFYVCWVADYREQFRIRDELNMAIKDRFEEEDIEIPFPQRDIHIRTSGAITT